MSAQLAEFDFSAQLFVNGYPLVLSHQYLQQRLLDKRITTQERLQVEAELLEREAPRFVTVAAHEDDAPLVFEFRAVGEKRYELGIRLPGKYDGWRLRMDPSVRYMKVDDSATSALFSLNGVEGERLSLEDLKEGHASVVLISEERQSGVYLTRTNFRNKYMDPSVVATKDFKQIFVDINPNYTGHDVFNGRVATFIIKVVESRDLDAR